MTRQLAVCLSILLVAGCSKRSFRMSSGSMLPGYAMGMSFKADTSVKTPARGEVWVFRFPEQPEQEFAKRIVGLPGDHIATRDHAVVLNGKPLPSCVVGMHSYDEQGTAHAGRLVMEKSDAAAYLTFIEDISALDDAAGWGVAAGEFFVVGDNRKNSHDSRHWRGGKGGGVPRAMLVGRVDQAPLALPLGAEALAPAFAKCKAELGVTP